MKGYFRRAAAVMLTAAAFAAFPSAVAADAAYTQGKKIVVIGDGISSGENLEEVSNSYVFCLERYYQTEIVNLSADKCTSATLLTSLDDPAVQAQLAQADIIIYSAGVQDIMEPFQQEVDRFMAEKNLNFKGIDEIFAARRSSIDVTDDELSAEANKLAASLRTNRESCKENILAIGEKLSAYQNAEIIGLNVYNPLSQIEQYSGLSMNRKTSYNTIMNPAKSIMNNFVNAAYQENAETYGFKVVNLYMSFEKLAYKYTGLNQMNYYPNADGHERIATLLKTVLGPATESNAMGDVNGDREINSKDATMILIASTKTALLQSNGLTEAQNKVADVNNDGEVNAKDATIILRFSVAYALDSTLQFEEFAKSYSVK